LFSESNGRFVVEVKPGNEPRFREILEDTVFAEIGCVNSDEKIVFESEKNKIKIQEDPEVLLNYWRSTINW
jgi:phosphoribosylformylglycinamidine synthase